MLKGEASRLYEDGRHYDGMFGGENPSPFWVNQAKESGGKVLELACGTGAIAIPLARAGFEVTGIDLSDRDEVMMMKVLAAIEKLDAESH